MKWTTISAIIGTVLLVTALSLKLVGYEDKAEAYEPSDAPVVIQEGDPIQQKHSWGWGKIPTQNHCPHCGVTSYTRFCTDCKKERGNLPFIGVYCPKCSPNGKYASKTGDVAEICGDCGSDKTWKYVYEDWPNEPNEPIEGMVRWNESARKPKLEIYTPEGWKSVDELEEPEPNEPEDIIWYFPPGCYNNNSSVFDSERYKLVVDKPDWEWPKCSECGVKVHITESHWCPKQILRYIPTWPDYIELEKELVIDPKAISGENWICLFKKGTKIYFKE